MAQYKSRNNRANDGTWFIQTVDEPIGRCDVYVWKSLPDGKRHFVTFVNGQISLKHHNDGDIPEPTLKLPNDLWYVFADLLGQVVPDIKRGEIDAELKATKYHLEDMRSLALKQTK